ncbi:unnamed protein product [Porites lobata]|uniref:G-protein coupled receptors family 1 profile domain-containing protein n=1 Tax=Porites lobata TaxID=104759 RepID=A0ABN8S119_9CNID|nr:unnamed protein product [Porites lobata]
MASSDLLYPIFVIPWRLSNLHTNYSFLIGGQLGQALCKLLLFFSNVSIVMLTQNLILIAVDRFGAVLFPLRLPLIRSKLCSFFILATWMFAIVFIAKDLLAFALVEYPEGARCVRRWKKVFGESSSFASLLLAYNILFTYIPVLLLVILYSIIFIKFKTQAHPGKQKPVNYFITNMTSSDLLFPIFFTPWTLSHLHTTSFLIGGRIGQAFCKPVPFFGEVSFKVSIQNLVLIAVFPFGAVVFPLCSPLIRSKLCPFFILATWIVAVAISSPYLFAKELFESPERNLCVTKCKKVFGESSSRTSLLLAYIILFTYIPVLLLAILYSNIFIKLKTQDTQVNSPPTLSNSGKEETETCFKCPLLSLQCLCFAGYLSLSNF